MKSLLLFAWLMLANSLTFGSALVSVRTTPMHGNCGQPIIVAATSGDAAQTRVTGKQSLELDERQRWPRPRRRARATLGGSPLHHASPSLTQSRTVSLHLEIKYVPTDVPIPPNGPRHRSQRIYRINESYSPRCEAAGLALVSLAVGTWTDGD